MATTTDPAPVRADRNSLIELTDRYLGALCAHDPGSAPLAPDVRMSEDLRPIRPGEGLWTTTTGGPTRFAIYVPDPENQSVGYLGMLQRDDGPILVALRLKLDRGQLTECEHLIATNVTDSLDNLHRPRPDLLTEIPQPERLDEPTLIAIGATYYDALDDNDGSLAPFAPDCERHENGLITAGPNLPPLPDSGLPPVASDCTGQIDSGIFTYIKTIDNRRVFAADPVTGLAMGLSQFRQPMDNIPYPVTLADGTTISYDPDFAPFDLPAAHIWKIGPDHQIHEIEAMGFVAPSGSPTGW